MLKIKNHVKKVRPLSHLLRLFSFVKLGLRACLLSVFSTAWESWEEQSSPLVT